MTVRAATEMTGMTVMAANITIAMSDVQSPREWWMIVCACGKQLVQNIEHIHPCMQVHVVHECMQQSRQIYMHSDMYTYMTQSACGCVNL